MNEQSRRRALDHDGAGRAAGRGRGPLWLPAAHHGPPGARACAGARSWLPAGFRARLRLVPAAFRAAANARSSRSSTRTATSASTTRNARLRASPLPPIPDLEAADSGAAAVREADSDAEASTPGSPGPKVTPDDDQVLSIGAALRPRHAPDDLPPVRERGLGAGARRLQQYRRRSARNGNSRWQDLQGRRRSFSRRLVVHDGAGGVEAIPEPDVRLRRREAAPRQLPHAESPEPERGSHVRPAGRATPRSRDSTYPRRRRTTCAW